MKFLIFLSNYLNLILLKIAAQLFYVKFLIFLTKIGWRALSYAAARGKLSVVKLLIERGAELNCEVMLFVCRP